MANKRKIYSKQVMQARVSEFESIMAASRFLEIPEATIRRICKGTNKNVVKRFVITSAQNKTDVHEDFLKSLERYCQENNAELVVMRVNYRNPTSLAENRKQEAQNWFDPRVRPYLLDSKLDINNNLALFPCRIRPTAGDPLTGYESFTKNKSGIFPHPKIRYKSIPTPSGNLAKIQVTTGSVTVENYSKSKEGDKGKHHQITGACIVEVKDEDIFFLRQIVWSNKGYFCDIAQGVCKRYHPNKPSTKDKIDSIFMGDEHFPFIEKSSVDCTIDMCQRFKPKKVYHNDITDFWEQNHHEINNNFLNYAKELFGKMNVEKSFENLAKYLEDTIKKTSGVEHVIVQSNHDEALDRWLNEAKLNRLGINAKYFHWLCYQKMCTIEEVANGFSVAPMLEFALREKMLEKYSGKLRFITEEEDERRLGVKNSYHGHRGLNGAKGSVKSFSKIGVKVNIAHIHSPEIFEGVYLCGTNCKKLSYAKGASGWTNTDTVTYSNGKRTLITKIKGEYFLKD